jgi:hypothetical protein
MWKEGAAVEEITMCVAATTLSRAISDMDYGDIRALSLTDQDTALQTCLEIHHLLRRDVCY